MRTMLYPLPVLVCCFILSTSHGVLAVDETPLPLQKGRVELQIHASPQAVSPEIKQHWYGEVARLIKNSWGSAVDFQIVSASAETNDKLVAPTQFDLKQLAHTRIKVDISRTSSAWELTHQSWQGLFPEWSAEQTKKVDRESLIPQQIAVLVAEACTPLVRITSVSPEQIEGELLGGEFPAADESTSLLRLGDYLGVKMMYYDREGILKAEQPLRWTYLRVRERQRARVLLDTISAFRSPIPRSRRRVEVVAYRMNTPFESTTARILVRSTPPRNYPLTRVLVSRWESPANAKSDEPASPAPAIQLLTDREGKLQLPAGDFIRELETRLVKLEVLSGDSVVARVPFLAGSVNELEIEVPDDSARLQAEAQFEQLKTQLLRITAKRATLIAALKQLIDSDREVDPKPILAELDALPTADEFSRRVTLIRVPAMETLNALGNRVAARQVQGQADQSTALIQRYLDPEAVEDIKLQLNLAEAPQPTQTQQSQEPAQSSPKRSVVIPKFD